MPQHERAAICLQTEAAIDWKYADDPECAPIPLDTTAIVDYVVKEYLYRTAGRWKNQRIRDYLSQAS